METRLIALTVFVCVSDLSATAHDHGLLAQFDLRRVGCVFASQSRGCNGLTGVRALSFGRGLFDHGVGPAADRMDQSLASSFAKSTRPSR